MPILAAIITLLGALIALTLTTVFVTWIAYDTVFALRARDDRRAAKATQAGR